VEVAASSASYDLHEKLEAYRRNGVQEYIVWRTLDSALDWFVLEAGHYVPQKPDEHGRLHSGIFPGLTLAVDALVAGDLAAVLATQLGTDGL
jgi:Uma2 family endonuclease